MGSWKKTRIEEFLFEREGKYKPDDKGIAGLRRIDKIDFLGNFHIVQKNSKTNMIMICPGDLVISGINVAKGAMGIYHGDKNVTATIHYSSYTFDTDKIDVEYFKRFLKSTEFIRLLQDKVKGGIKTEIKPKHLLPLEIELPDIEEQKQTVEHFKSIETEDTELKQELIHQQTLLKKLRQQILQEAIEGKLTADWRQKQKLSPCQGGVPQSGEGVRGEVVERIQKEVKKLNNLPYLKTFRKTLRKNLTPAEAKFWTLLKNKQLDGRRFRRQYSVANYILDFFCPAEKLAIELDGEVHSSTKAVKYDRERDIFLAHTGIKVLRFENQFVFHDPDGLLARIKQEFNPSASARHLPLAGEEFESASELLKRIQTEKEQLIKDKKIRKQKPLPPISEEEKPFELPDGWVWCRLGDYALFERGKFSIRPRNDPSCFGGEYPFIQIGSLDSNGSTVNDHKQALNDKGLSVSKLFEKGTIMVAIVGGTIGNLGVLGKDMCFTDSMAGVRPKKQTCQDFILMLLRYYRPYVLELSYQMAGQPNIKLPTLNNLVCALPPIKEQQAIVAKVEKLLALCDQLEAQVTQNQAHAEQLMQAVLKEAFTYMEPRKTLI